ncbi:MAG: hypothetical protein Q4G68_06280 [Planctomycetia bacterium]|nr:hypothetical protein [Planctomycetia bacterium]
MKTSVALLACILLTIAGCGGSGLSVGGAVSYDGKPVDNGSIGFVAAGGGTTYGADIKGGKWNRKLPPGSYDVSIVDNTKKQLDKPYVNDIGQTVETETVTTIPDCYNVNSTLKVDIEPGKKVYDFLLAVPDNTENVVE